MSWLFLKNPSSLVSFLIFLAILPGVAQPTAAQTPRQPSPEITLSRLAFGSCSYSNRPQPLWDPILATDPQLWVWLGDNIYGDSEDVRVLTEKYRRARENEGYRRLMASVPVVGTWDDHDFGVGDGGKEYPSREGSQAALLDFLGEPDDSPRRLQEGVYTSYTLGTPPRQVKLILLDVRYHRDPPGPLGDVLGEEQWAWLEQELEESEAQIHLIGSGFQFLPVDHRFEKWANFPESLSRLFRVIAGSRAPGVVLLSGDRHLAEISKVAMEPLLYPLFEITSSGMTHFVTRPNGEENRHREGQLFTGLNFGVVEIVWDGPSPLIRLQIRGEEGTVGVEVEVGLDHLTPGR